MCNPTRSTAAAFLALLFLSGCSVFVEVTKVRDTEFEVAQLAGEHHPGLYYGLPKTEMHVRLPFTYRKPGLPPRLFESLAQACTTRRSDSWADPMCRSLLEPEITVEAASVTTQPVLDHDHLYLVNVEGSGAFTSASLGIEVTDAGVLTGFNGKQSDSTAEVAKNAVTTLVSGALAVATGGISAIALNGTQAVESTTPTTKLKEHERDERILRMTYEKTLQEIKGTDFWHTLQANEQQALQNPEQLSVLSKERQIDLGSLNSLGDAQLLSQLFPERLASSPAPSDQFHVLLRKLLTAQRTLQLAREKLTASRQAVNPNPTPPKECTCGYIKSVWTWLEQNGGVDARAYQAKIQDLFGDRGRSSSRLAPPSNVEDGNARRVSWEYLERRKSELEEQNRKTLASYGVQETQQRISLDLSLKPITFPEGGDYCRWASHALEVVEAPNGTAAAQARYFANEALSVMTIGVTTESRNAAPGKDNDYKLSPKSSDEGCIREAPVQKSEERESSGPGQKSAKGFAYRFPMRTDTSICATFLPDPWPDLALAKLNKSRMNAEASRCAIGLYMRTGICNLDAAKKVARESGLLSLPDDLNKLAKAGLESACETDAACKQIVGAMDKPCTGSDGDKKEEKGLNGAGVLVFKGETPIAQFGRLVSLPLEFAGKSVSVKMSTFSSTGGLTQGEVDSVGVFGD